MIAMAQIGIRRVRNYAREAVGNDAAGASSSLHFAVEWAFFPRRRFVGQACPTYVFRTDSALDVTV
jgi:hypothetical protein